MAKLYKITIDGKDVRFYSDIRQAKQTMNVYIGFGHNVGLEEVEESA